MKTDDEVLETIDAALMRIHAPSGVLPGALREARRMRRRRRLQAGVGAAAAVATVSVAVVVGGAVLSGGSDRSLAPITQPTASTGSATDSSRPPGDLLDAAEMTTLLTEIAPGHEFSDMHTWDNEPWFIGDPEDGGRDMLQLYGTVDGTFFTIFVGTTQPMPDDQLRVFTECGPNPSAQVVYCDGGYKTYPGGTSRLMMQTALGAQYNDHGQIVDGTSNSVTLNSASVFYPTGLNVGAQSSNSASQGNPPTVTDEPVFSLDELEQIVTDPRWIAALES